MLELVFPLAYMSPLSAILEEKLQRLQTKIESPSTWISEELVNLLSWKMQSSKLN